MNSATAFYADYSLAGDAPTLEMRCRDFPEPWTSLLAPIFGSDAALHVERIKTGGSNRSFCRVGTKEDPPKTVVVCVTPDRAEHGHYIVAGRFLRSRGIRVPEILACCDRTGVAVLEDGGRKTLQDVVLERGFDDPHTLEAYRIVLAEVGRLHALAASECPSMAHRPFVERDLRWETEYFRENFLGRHLGWDLHQDADLTADFERLAARVQEEPLLPMHRDFQSQNVLFEDGKIAIVDFQGVRSGPLPYDLASLLRDPYVSMPADVEDVLLRFYHSHAMPVCPATHRYRSWETFRSTYAVVSLQRIMQALGAYGFLGIVKGKPWFGQWIRPALRNLLRAVEEVEGLPRLRQVVREAVEREPAHPGLSSNP